MKNVIVVISGPTASGKSGLALDVAEAFGGAVVNADSMQVYADKLISILQKEGFDIYSINCKESGLQGEEISPEMSGPNCDPISQAEFLNSRQTEFNINLGLCLGHGLLFSKYSKAPVTTIVVKDPSTSHNFIANLL